MVGPSGCAKSTLLELMAGLSTATAGTIAFEDKPVAGAVPDGVGVVFQEDASIPWLTVAENIAFGLRRAPLPPKERAMRVEGALAMMGLPTLPRVIRRSSPAACANASVSRARW